MVLSSKAAVTKCSGRFKCTKMQDKYTKQKLKPKYILSMVST